MTSTNARKHAPAIQTDDVLRMLQQHHHAVMQLPCAFMNTKDCDTSVVDMHSTPTSIDTSLQLSAQHCHIDVSNKRDDSPTTSTYAVPCAFNDYACNSILERQQPSYTSLDADASSASICVAADETYESDVDATTPACTLASTASNCMHDHVDISQLDVPYVAMPSVEHDAEDLRSHSFECAKESMAYRHQQCQITYTSKDNTTILFHSEPHSIHRLSTATVSGNVAAAEAKNQADTAYVSATSTLDAVDTTSKAVPTHTAKDSSLSSDSCADNGAIAAKAKALANAHEEHYAQIHKMHLDAIQSAYAYASALNQAHKMQEKLSVLHGQLKEKLTAEHILEQVKDSHLAELLHHKNEAYERHSSHHKQQLQPSVAQLTKEHCI